ncbi:helix-turn-helix domain-containing protein [Streptococcus ovuberis]|uniref:Helix-turn-helix domain-containing protein n=1 Tax=Streptococcus ovuberis TaxID=1936207 RepID=A0A7X6N215_9STRE|nr:helix-turn-helix transcriptional regulator [Streptococcus ovuberis]NKZ20664.1 helix-turn-helix domain-containing protein [Streptococcus ovuberis]
MHTIGQKIKALRLKTGLSQTQLAEKLGLSNQAISKWETNFSQPDIGLLPDLASLFGIRIDDLFDYTSENFYKKIENTLEYGTPLTHQEFQQFETFLLGQLTEVPDHYRASSILGGLYLKYADQLKKKAVTYAKKALELEPNSKYTINIINNASEGALYDWDVKNHHDLIDYYQKTLLVAPENKRLYFYLLDNLIDDRRLEDARQTLKASYEHNPDPLNDYYTIFIEEAAKGFAAVKADYLNLAGQFADDWRVLFSVANSFSQNGYYQEAIPIWEAAFHAQEKPRYTDYYESIAQCYIRLGNKTAAIEAYKQVLKTLKEDWNYRFGSDIDRINDKILQLSSNE